MQEFIGDQGMHGYVYLKHKLGGGSILSATIPAVTEAKH